MRQSVLRKALPVMATIGISLLAVESRAAVVTSVYTAPSTKVDPSAAGVNRTFSVTANQFNGSLGTLNSIDVTWSATESITATSSSAGGGFSWTGGGTIAFNGSSYGGFGLSGGASGASGQSISSSDTEGNETVLVGGVNTSPTTITGAIGSGSFPVTYAFTGSYNSGSVISPQYASSATVTVAYNYTAVPEPVGMSVLALGAVGTLCRRSRRA